MMNVNELKTHLAQGGGPLLGKIVSPGLSGVEIGRDALLKIWVDECHLPPGYISKGIQTRSAVLRTMHEMEVSGFIRKIDENNKRAVWVLVNEQIDQAAEDVQFTKEDKLIYDKKDGRLLVGNPHFQPVVDAQMEKFKYLYTTQDVSRFIFKMMGDHGLICMKSGSGFYFAPSARFDFVAKLEKLIKALNGHLVVLDIAQGSASSGEVMRAYQTETMQDIEELVAKLSEMNAGATGARADKSRDARLQEYQVLKARVELYTETMSGFNDRIAKAMEGLRNQVRIAIEK